VVKVKEDTSATTLQQIWLNTREYLHSYYKRKAKLTEWHEATAVLEVDTFQDLADKLEAQFRSSSRKRPDFTPKIKESLKTKGGSLHRRHIVMSSLMRNAVYKVVDSTPATKQDELRDKFNAFIGFIMNRKATNATLEQAANELVFVMHNNPANLVPDTGDWNSAIGAFAHNVEEKLQNLKVAHEEFKADSGKFMSSLVKGFQPHLQKEIAGFWTIYVSNNPIDDIDAFQELLESMYDNAAFDLLSNKALPKEHTVQLTEVHKLLAEAASTGKADTLLAAVKIFTRLPGVEDYEAVFK
jgi:hypothetical protein